ncbi:hypothetical protein ACQ5SO_16370 [Rhodovulum sp. DZ06]|uniref:hypothetical protein n=1 Tax=Rhodovulum sp. DZ06 TaxID=3425126 RepID=UPI003D3520AE
MTARAGGEAPPDGETGAELRARALAAQKAGRAAEAQALWRAHLAEAPDDAGAWANLGALLRRAGAHDAAALHHRRAAELLPGDARILANLANALADADRTAEALDARRAAAALRPDDPAFHAALIGALRADGRHAAAARALEQARARWPQDRGIAAETARAALAAMDWAGAVQALARARPEGVAAAPRKDGADGPIHVIPEGGASELLLAARALPAAAARLGALRLPCPIAWQGTLARALAGAPVSFCAPDEAAPPGAPLVPLLDLLALPGAEGGTPPPPLDLAPPGADAPPAREGRPLRVGLLWNPEGAARRAPPLGGFAALAETPGIRLFNLSPGPAAVELERSAWAALIPNAPPLDAPPPGAAQGAGFDELLRAAAGMDAVVAAECAEAHAVASIADGPPVFTLVPADAGWALAGESDRTPWHETMRVIRRAPGADWRDAITETRARLSRLARRRG